MKKILLTLILILYGCGYQPIYINKNLNNLEFKEIILKGEKDLNRIIVDSLSLKENKSVFFIFFKAPLSICLTLANDIRNLSPTSLRVIRPFL